MGASVQCYAAVGVKVPKSKLYKSRRQRGCSHLQLGSFGGFCSQCGKPIWVGEDARIDGLHENNGGNLFLIGFPVIMPGYDSSKDEAIVCVYLVQTEDDPMCGGWAATRQKMLEDPVALDEREARFRKVLETLGLWDESQYGLWAIGVCHG